MDGPLSKWHLSPLSHRGDAFFELLKTDFEKIGFKEFKYHQKSFEPIVCMFCWEGWRTVGRKEAGREVPDSPLDTRHY